MTPRIALWGLLVFAVPAAPRDCRNGDRACGGLAPARFRHRPFPDKVPEPAANSVPSPPNMAPVLDAGNAGGGRVAGRHRAACPVPGSAFHGFEASPALQGTPQGIAVYQNGVRVNKEAFGDTVNWDAIPQAAIARLDVWSSNPVFDSTPGRFGQHGDEERLYLARRGASLQGEILRPWHGQRPMGPGRRRFQFLWRRGRRSDEGWRFSFQSSLARLYADAGWRFGDSEIHLVASGAATSLRVVGRRHST